MIIVYGTLVVAGAALLLTSIRLMFTIMDWEVTTAKMPGRAAVLTFVYIIVINAGGIAAYTFGRPYPGASVLIIAAVLFGITRCAALIGTHELIVIRRRCACFHELMGPLPDDRDMDPDFDVAEHCPVHRRPLPAARIVR